MMMIAKMYDGYYDPDTGPQLIVVLTPSHCMQAYCLIVVFRLL
jgi:hypothetical protein